MSSLNGAVRVIKSGGIIIFPTDTAYAIGCALDNTVAIERLYKIKNRSVDKPCPVLVDTVKMAQDYLQPISQKVIDNLIEPYWPGGLTIVLPCKTSLVHPYVRGGSDSLGVRIPSSSIARYIIRNSKTPIIGTSANFSSYKTPFRFEEIDSKLISLVDHVVKEDIKSNTSSTVIDCTGDNWKILRKGSIEIDLSKINNYERS